MVALLEGMHPVAQAVLIICLIVTLGLAFGAIRYKGIGLGIGGVLFAGILIGHLGLGIDPDVAEFLREFGLILFVYTIGIQVGPAFFEALKRSGLALNAMAAALVIMGALIAVAIHLIADLPLPVVIGLFSGAVTNTPSLGAGQQVLTEFGADPAALALPGLGYAVTYPFGIAGILIVMLLIRFVLRIDIDAEARKYEESRRAKIAEIDTLDVVINNENLNGEKLKDIPGINEAGVICSRIRRNGVLDVADPDMALRVGDALHLVGPKERLKHMEKILGERTSESLTTKNTNVRWERLVVTDASAYGKRLAALNASEAYGVVISRVNRAGTELFPAADLKLQFGDIITVIGHPEDIDRLMPVIGNNQRRLHQAQIIPIFVGIALGLILGSLPLHLPGMPAALKLGLAGGPLIAAIVLARIGSIGPLVWFMPPSANHVLREIGIVLFLAVVGLKSGERFVETIIAGDGLLWMGYGVLITFIPLCVVALFARLYMRTNYLSLCGLLAGSMTDPPALAFANAISPQTNAPALAYSTVYPLVMFLRILAPQIIVIALWPGGG